MNRGLLKHVAPLLTVVTTLCTLLTAPPSVMSIHRPLRRADSNFLDLLEAAALAAVAARDAAQDDGDDDSYDDSCDAAIIVVAAVIRGEGAAGFLRVIRVNTPPLVVLLAEKAAISLVDVVIS